MSGGEPKPPLRDIGGGLRIALKLNITNFHRDGKDLDKLVAWMNQYPDAFPMWVGKLFGHLTVTNPEYAKVVLGRSDPKTSTGYRFLIPWIVQSLQSRSLLV
ncbi:cytochrome P450 4B1-like [Pelobates cultripes]|uniref:Cytochrome P450 4B1-like n=1 Tax=Pelobates cultripes TaxID=61616 RepID=A0AAD1SS15_PELCU|nr:cytochrome P450 4B1-like [Pelobates cultripes]